MANATTLFVYIGRVLLTLAFISLVGAWFAHLSGGFIVGLAEQHFFNDAIVFALLGIGAFLDALWHARNV